METFDNGNGRPILMRIVAAIQANKAYLSEVDGLIGDGDHGMNMNKGFTLFANRIGDREIAFGDGLDELGLVLLNEIGGSMGPIYGTFFMAMAETLADGLPESGRIDLARFQRMLTAGQNALFELVDARVGDKTLIDTLSPAVTALEQAVADGMGFGEALAGMKAAAERGRDSTQALVARYGRSSRLGERSRGVLDAGAVSCCLILEALADGVTELLAD